WTACSAARGTGRPDAMDTRGKPESEVHLSTSNETPLGGADCPGAMHRIPIACMRPLYHLDAVSQRLGKLPLQEHEGLRNTYERMLERGAERFQVKPSGLPAMDRLYDELPNFHAALDDVKRQIG